MRTKETIEREIKDLESKVFELKKELSERTNFILMYIEKSGKHTFVMHPIWQKENLISAGWKVYSKLQMKNFLDGYDF